MSDIAWIATFVTGALLVVSVFVGAFVLGGSRIQKHYDHIACTQFGKQANRQVKFVTYNFWAWDCLTPTADGKWISTKNLREFGEQP